MDWVITNLPFNQAEAFTRHSRRVARRGVAMLVRTSFLESVGRAALSAAFSGMLGRVCVARRHGT